jgi:hypothetical protein
VPGAWPYGRVVADPAPAAVPVHSPEIIKKNMNPCKSEFFFYLHLLRNVAPTAGKLKLARKN